MNIQDAFARIDKMHHSDFEDYIGAVLTRTGWNDVYRTRPGIDERHGDGGIDLLATRNGRRYAVEVKHRRNNASLIGVDALNQLVAGSELHNISRRILVTNARFTQAVHERAIRLGVNLVDRAELKTLVESELAEYGRKIKARRYQQAIIDQVLSKHSSGTRKFLIEMATGLGKTYTAALLCRELLARGEAQRVLFVAHQRELLMQAHAAFRNIFGISGPTFSGTFGGSSLEPTDITFATFQTLTTQLPRLSASGFDLVIMDEAHHVGAATFREVLDSANARTIIGLTATPTRTDGRSVHEAFGGSEGHVGRYGLPWALKHGHLAKLQYQVITDDLTNADIAAIAPGLSLADLNRQVFLHRRDDEIVRLIDRHTETAQAAEPGYEPRAIVFCRSISHIASLLPHFGAGRATVAHSEMSMGERQRNIQSFREGAAAFILTCDLFNEGVDIPETNTLVFLRPTQSRTIFFQQLGRGLRRTPRKSKCHVFDFVGTVEAMQLVDDLSQSVKATPIERDNLAKDEDGFQTTVSGIDDTVEGQSEEYHDNSIEVTFTEHAAKVRSIIRDLTLDLASAQDMIDALSRLRSKRETPATIVDYCAATKFTEDQVSTLFGNYFALMERACGKDTAEAMLTNQMQPHVETLGAHFGNTNLISLLADATNGDSPVCSAQQIEVILNTVPAPLTHKGTKPNSTPEPHIEPQPQSSTESGTPSTRAQEFARQYGIDLNRTDLGLSPEATAHAHKQFGSLHVLRRLLL